jgi:DNA-binding NtrC family response regulator
VSPTSKTERPSLLLVDDEDAARVALRGHFEELGWNVLAARDGEEAVELCRTTRSEIQALLIDYVLPAARGDRVASEVLKLHPNAALVYMSGYPDLTLDPPGALLVKPLDLDAIATTVEDLVERRRRRVHQNSSS